MSHRHIGVLTYSATFKQSQITPAVLDWYLNVCTPTATEPRHASDIVVLMSGLDTDFMSWFVTLALPLDNLYSNTAGRTNQVSHVSGVTSCHDTSCHASFRWLIPWVLMLQGSPLSPIWPRHNQPMTVYDEISEWHHCNKASLWDQDYYEGKAD